MKTERPTGLPEQLRQALRNQGALGSLSWAHFLNDGYANFLPGILPVLLTQLSIPLSLVGSLTLALSGLGSLLQPLLGWWADRLGGRRFVLAGLALSSLGAGLVGLAPSYAVLLLLLILAGIGNATFHPQAMAAARSQARGRHGVTLSVFLIGGELGRGLWPSIAGLIVVVLGLHGLWLIAVPGLLTLPLLYRRAPSLPPKATTEPAGIAGGWPVGAVLALVGFVGLRSLVSYGVATFVPVLWHQQGGSLLAGASLITVMLVVGIVGNAFGGTLADVVGRRPVLLASSVLSAAFLGVFVLASGLWLWVVLGLLGIASFMTAPVTLLIGQDLFPNNRSMASGIALGVGNAVGASIVFGMGFVAAAYGIPTALAWVAGASLLGLPLALALPERAGASS
ncbi:MAG: MFS transporter [Chloroflexi bacterium]|nr:MFS transporter [Chloroflexota bacterium]